MSSKPLSHFEECLLQAIDKIPQSKKLGNLVEMKDVRLFLVKECPIPSEDLLANAIIGLKRKNIITIAEADQKQEGDIAISNNHTINYIGRKNK